MPDAGLGESFSFWFADLGYRLLHILEKLNFGKFILIISHNFR